RQRHRAALDSADPPAAGARHPAGPVTRRGLIAAALLLFAACSRRPDVPILSYHSISNAADAFSLRESEFISHLDALRRAGFHTVTFHEWLAHEDHGPPLPA